VLELITHLFRDRRRIGSGTTLDDRDELLAAVASDEIGASGARAQDIRKRSNLAA
jgi:hypothetical protein